MKLIAFIGKRVDLIVLQPDKPITVGRRPSSTIELRDPKISGSHLTISLMPDGVTLAAKDLSTNGTFVNGRPLARGVETPLRHGDIVSPIVMLRSPPWKLTEEKLSLLAACFIAQGDPPDPPLHQVCTPQPAALPPAAHRVVLPARPPATAPHAECSSTPPMPIAAPPRVISSSSAGGGAGALGHLGTMPRMPPQTRGRRGAAAATANAPVAYADGNAGGAAGRAGFDLASTSQQAADLAYRTAAVDAARGGEGIGEAAKVNGGASQLRKRSSAEPASGEQKKPRPPERGADGRQGGGGAVRRSGHIAVGSPTLVHSSSPNPSKRMPRPPPSARKSAEGRPAESRLRIDPNKTVTSVDDIFQHMQATS